MPKKILQILPWCGVVSSGILLGIAYPPLDIEWLAWIALCPLVAVVWFAPAWSRREPLRLFLLGWLAGSIGFCINLFWITEVTALGWFFLALYCGIYPGLFTLFLGTIGKPKQRVGKPLVWLSSRSNLGYSALGAAAWTATEWLRGTLFTGFGWNSLGVSMWKNTPMIQIADLFGVGGISFLICMVSLVLVATVRRLAAEVGTGRMKPHYDFALTLALVALAFVYGIRQMLAPAPESAPLRFAAVQANVPQEEKWDPEFAERILERYRDLSEQAVAMDPDLLLWPEAATPRAVFHDRTTTDLVGNIATSWTGDFLLGTVFFDETGDFNSVLLLTGPTPDTQIQHKIHLVPFGEYIPFRHSFPLFAWIIGDLVPSDFDSGTEFQILETVRKPVSIGALVCFEDTLGNLARQFILRGANLFVTVTNDGWFRESSGSVQHLAQSVFRCAENKIPMIRAANTGVTCSIDRFGRVQDLLADESGWTFLEGVLHGEVQIPTAHAPTVFTRFGEWFSQWCLLLTMAACVPSAARAIGSLLRGVRKKKG